VVTAPGLAGLCRLWLELGFQIGLVVPVSCQAAVCDLQLVCGAVLSLLL